MTSLPKDKLILIIGAMKSGTSTLFELLSQHPEICASKIKEPEYFSQKQSHKASLTSYEDLWDFHSSIHSFFMEASTGYTKYPEEKGVPERIFKEGYAPFFIYIVRDPIQRIQSEYNYIRFHPHLNGPDNPLEEFYISKSRYFSQLERFFSCFPDTRRYFVLRMEDLVSDPLSSINSIFRWLELPPISNLEDKFVNPTPKVSKIELLFRKPSIYWLRNLVPTSFREALRRAMLKFSGTAQYQLSQDQISFLKKELQPEMDRLNQKFHTDVSSWGF